MKMNQNFSNFHVMYKNSTDMRTEISYLFIYFLIFQSSYTDFFIIVQMPAKRTIMVGIAQCLSTPTSGNSQFGYHQQQKAT